MTSVVKILVMHFVVKVALPSTHPQYECIVCMDL